MSNRALQTWNDDTHKRKDAMLVGFALCENGRVGRSVIDREYSTIEREGYIGAVRQTVEVMTRRDTK